MQAKLVASAAQYTQWLLQKKGLVKLNLQAFWGLNLVARLIGNYALNLASHDCQVHSDVT